MTEITGTHGAFRPTDNDVDAFGLSHRGHVRAENEDGYLVASLHQVLRVHQTSLPDALLPKRTSEHRGWVFLVADGVGGRPGGKQASRTALAAVARYLTHMVELHTTYDPNREPEFVEELRRSVAQGHAEVLAAAAVEADDGAATTLTMVTVVWPRAYLLHVGDSRCYRLRGGELQRLTIDQTLAQAMVDAGAISPEQAEKSGLRHVLWSAIGGRELSMQVASGRVDPADVMLLCSDGLTKHVADQEIRAAMLRFGTAESLGRHLVDLALERGGSDNVTVVAARIRPR